MTDYSSVWRTGTAAAATTAPGTPPAYGLAADLGSTPMNPWTFLSMARDITAYRQANLIQQAQAGVPESLHALELQKAQNYARYGQFALNGEVKSLRGLDDVKADMPEGHGFGAFLKGTFVEPAENALSTAGSAFSTGAALVGSGASALTGFLTVPTDHDYAEYKSKGGLLTEEEFNSFGEGTRVALLGHARLHATVSEGVTGAVAQGIGTTFETAYHGLSVPFRMIGQETAQNPNGVPLTLANIMNPMWFQPGRYAQAWRESTDSTPTTELLNSVLNPYTSDQQLDDLRRNSALFQFTALAGDFALGWKLDPGVLAGKGLGGTARIYKNEMPLNETGQVFKGITERLQRESITVKGPVGKYADFRADRMFAARNPINQLAKETDFADFANIMNRNLGKRSTGKTPAMWALHYAVNKGDDALVDLTWQAVNGDPKAWARVKEMNNSTPEELKKWAPNAQHYLDAMNATKTRIKALEDEVDALSLRVPEDANLEPLFDWTHHTPAAKKQLELDEATNTLNKYEEYGTWLDLMSERTSLLTQTRSPRAYQRSFFKAGPYGQSHTVVSVARAAWLEKSSIASMHDLDSGRRTIDHLWAEWDHHYGYLDPDARAAAQDAWAQAPTAHDRYKVLYDLEDTYLPRAVASKFGVSEDFARGLINRIHSKQNQTKRGVLRGSGSVYDASPSLASRLRNPEDFSAKFESSDGDMVTVTLMDGRQQKMTLELPKEALAERVEPIDPTQTPNYYQPLDQRQLFYQLKRHEEMLGDVSLFEQAGVDVMEAIDHYATKFYGMWKPLQLWRLGWPQRVLMDEMARAVAIYGPMYLITGPGGEAVRAAGRNIPSHIAKYIDYKRHGHINIGEGPVTDSVKKSMDPFSREAEISNALNLPEYHWPKYDQSRRVSIDKANVEWGKWLRAQANDEMLPMREFAPAKEHPMGKVYRDWMTDVREGDAPLAVFDPVTGLRIHTGRVVPVEDPQLMHQLTESTDIYSPEFRAALGWHEKNAQLLSNSGYRIVVHKDGKVGIGRVFTKRGEFRKALDFQKIAHYHFTGTPMWDLDDLSAPTLIHDVSPPTPDMRKILDEELRTIKEDEFVESLNVDQFNDLLDIEQTRLERLLETKKIGTGMIHGSKDGVPFEYPDVFGGHDGQITKALVSSEKAIDYVSQGKGTALDLFHHQMQGHVVIHPPSMAGADKKFLKKGTVEHKRAVLYYNRYADMVNNQIGNSPIWSRMLRGESDEQVIAYLHTPEGARVVREAMPESWSPELWVLEHRQKLDYYLPNRALQRVLAKRRVTPSEINRSIPQEHLPDIFGPDIEVLDKRRGVGKTLSDTATHIWRGLGTLPIDALSRHPFAKAAYDMKMKSLINVTDAKWLDAEMINNFSEIARQYATNQVKRHLWDLTEQTHFTDAVRFIAPFWGAQQEAIVKWLRIISDRPETVARVFAGQRALYNSFAVIDENGEPVNERAAAKIRDAIGPDKFAELGFKMDGAFRKGGFFNLYHPTDRVIVPLPMFVRPEGLEFLGEIGIPLSSANTVLQGEMPLLPGMGPLITIPMDQLLRHMNDTQGVEYSDDFWYRWAFPIGRPREQGIMGSAWEQLSPSWMRKLNSAMNGDSRGAQSQYMQLFRAMVTDAVQKGEDPRKIKPADVAAASQKLWAIRVIGSMTMPVQMEFRPDFQYYLDLSHKYKQMYGSEYWDKFVDDYGPEFSIYATSSSNSPVDAPTTTQGMEEFIAGRDLFNKYPELGSLIFSPSAYTDEYNPDALNAQYNMNMGPGNSEKLREPVSPLEQIRADAERRGWRDFRAMSSALEAELSARGLHDIRQKGAEDLLMWKHEQIQQMANANPDWWEAKFSYDQSIYPRVYEMSQIAGDPRFDNRPDILGLRQYLILRNMATERLDLLYQQGGSRNLGADAPYNQQLSQWFFDSVGQLRLANPAFDDLYARWLEADTLEQGGGDAPQ